ncbi:MAG: hypothetical protein JWQ25_1863, partial [Daejeonella sp.]|nr:hypothetical protein [Daejeonella sp.]
MNIHIPDEESSEEISDLPNNEVTEKLNNEEESRSASLAENSGQSAELSNSDSEDDSAQGTAPATMERASADSKIPLIIREKVEVHH